MPKVSGRHSTDYSTVLFQYWSKFTFCNSILNAILINTVPVLKKYVLVTALPVSPLPGGRGESEEDDVRWSTSATAAERMREQTPLSLTERLKKEFGLDASEEEEMRTGAFCFISYIVLK